MRFRIWTRRWMFILVAMLSVPGSVFAQSSSSSNYRVDQTFFGSGGEIDWNSASYQGRASLGELGVDQPSSASYRVYAGFNTTDEPYLEFAVTNANIDLGYLSTSQTSTANGTFYVRAWQASGYVVRTEAEPPTSSIGSHQISPLLSPTASSTGSEQFGMNLVANTSPTTFGAQPLQVPDASFSFGTAATGYNTANQYKYAKGDIIAQATQSTSITIYTISYIFNIATSTRTGDYTFRHILVATATY